MILVKKLRTALLCLLLLVSMAPPSMALQGPYVPQTISGGPIIDASIFGNRELYPGQTTGIEIVIQNGGVADGILGYETPKPYPVTTTVTLPLRNSQVSDPSGGNNSTGIGGNGTASSTNGNGTTGSADTDKCGNKALATSPTPAPAPSSPASQSTSTAQASGLSGGDIATVLQGLTGLGSGSVSVSQTSSPLYDSLRINADPDIDIAATTALGVTARLSPGDAPIDIVSGDCVVGGSLPAGSVSPPFDFIVRIDRGARPGVYTLPLAVTYKHLAGEYDLKSAFGDTACYNNYVEDCVTIPIYVVIREAFDLVVAVAGYQNMVPGSDGIVTLRVSNVGGVCAEESVVYLMPSLPGAPQDGSPSSSSIAIQPSLVSPVQSAQYLGRMDPGDERLLNFKVAVSPDADAGTYPLSALVSYTDAWGKQKSSNVDTFGVPVQPEMKFSVDDTPLVIKCGRSCDATLNLTNVGPETARDAVVRMNALDPFVVSYDTAYLGDVRPGDSVNTTFGIKVKTDAVPTTYYVTMEVKYYDDKDDSHVTKIIRKAIVVAPPPTLLDNVVENWPLVAGLGFVALLGLLYAARSMLKGRRPGNKPPQVSPPAKTVAGKQDR